MPQLDQDYVFLPQRLLADLRANPAAIGAYALIARLFLIYQEPIPLSAADLQRYDPALSYGAARGALQRLVALRWLDERAGHKNHYTPTWGVIRGAAVPWRMDAPTLGRPAHVVTLRLDRRLLDIGLGRLIPHATYPAQTHNRYLEQPILGLRDVGSYAQALGGQTLAAVPALWRYGLIRDGLAQPLTSAADLVARASQRTLEGDGAAPTVQGLRLLGLERPSDQEASSRSRLLFFVDKALIPDLIPQLIPDLIPSAIEIDSPFVAAGGAETVSVGRARDMPGTQAILSERSDPPPNPPARTPGGGGRDQHTNKQSEHEEHQAEIEASLPETESARLLRSIGAFPSSIEELADLSAELVGAAIAYAEAEPGISSVPGWVVEALRRHRDQGWPIPEPRTKRLGMMAGDAMDVSAYLGGAYGDLFRLGSDLTGLAESELSAPTRTEDEANDPSSTRGASGELFHQGIELTNRDSSACAQEEHALGVSAHSTAAGTVLDEQLRAELLAQCGRRYRPVIAGLEARTAGSTTVLICANVSDMGVVQNELLGAIHGILARLGAPIHVVCTTRSGWEMRNGGDGNAQIIAYSLRNAAKRNASSTRRGIRRQLVRAQGNVP
jgi:hypothetical protein